MIKLTSAITLLSLYAQACSGQSAFLDDWFTRSDQAKASQPHWMTPLVTVTPRLEQEFRTDFTVQPFPGGDTVNYGNGKGLELIPSERVEILLNVPPYIEHNRGGVHDGFGDVSFVAKYRIAAREEEHGNYIVTAFLAAALPTGSYSNGARAAVISPTLAAGKGWGKFDVQSTLSIGLPAGSVDAIGHAIAFNNAFQYHVMPKLWPEFEVNSTFWKDGPLDGKTQTFLTPGIIFGRFRLHKRLAMALGAGVQIAVTQLHQYNHSYVFTIRFPF
jgi:hypothetical protein